MKYQLEDYVLVEKWQGGVVIFDVNSYDFLEFNEVGSLIVEEIEKGKEVEEIVDSIVGIYEVETEQAKADVLAFCRELEDNGIICKVKGN